MTPQGAPATVLITSTRDEASATIANGLLKNHGFESTEIALMGKPVYQKGSLLLVTIDSEIISPPDLDTYFNPQAYIFLSRHYGGVGYTLAHRPHDRQLHGGRRRSAVDRRRWEG